MCMMRVAKTINAPYEWQLHSAIGRNLGLTENEIAAIASDGPVTAPAMSRSGRGLIGLRERVLELGGTFAAGPAGAGGWAVEAKVGA